MASSEKFCLRWNDFESNVSTAFRDLREEKDFFDVTLACDDSSQVAAHKVILAACSPFFREVLRRNPHQHPLLYLKGVKYKELLSVLNFMYQGEVNVAQEELNQFLAVAEDLRVKGLTQGNSNSDNKAKSESKPRTAPVVSRDAELPPAKRQRPAPAASYQEDDEIQEVVPVKSEPPAADNSGYLGEASQQQGTVALDDAYNEESYDYGQYGEAGYDDGSGMIDPNTGMPLVGADGNKDFWPSAGFDGLDEIINCKISLSSSGSTYQCQDCSYSSSNKRLVVNHIESKHITTNGVECQFCKKNCPTREALRKHGPGQLREAESRRTPTLCQPCHKRRAKNAGVRAEPQSRSNNCSHPTGASP